MKYLYLLVFIISVSFTSVYAQSNYKPGYIVTLNGDTTKGFVDYKQWGHRNPATVTFKDANGNESNYAPADIGGFGINGYENYQASTVSISQNSLKLDDLVNYLDTASTRQKVFLRVIIAGEKVSLFLYEDALKNHCYVAEANSTPVELLRYSYLSPIDNTKIEYVNTFREQLQRLAATYQTGNALLSKQIQSVFYSEQDFAPIIQKINGGSAIRYVESRRSALRFFAGVGVNATSIRFTNGAFAPGGARWSYSPQITAGFDVLSNKNVAKLALRLEVSAYASRTTFKGETIVAPTTFNYEYVISRLTVSLSPQLLYNFYNANNLKVFAATGMTIAFADSSIPVNKATFTQNGKTTAYNDPITEAYRNFNYTATGKVGVTIKQLQFFGAYSLPCNIYSADSKTFKIILSSYQFGVNYFLGK